MPPFVKALSFLHNLFSSRSMDKDLDQEVHAHLEMLTEENIRAGMSPSEAQRAARIELGGIEQLKEQVRKQRLGNWLHSVASDCRFALRQLRKNPGFTAVALLTLALGIGANTALFSVVNGLLINPLPYPQPDQLVSLAETLPPFPKFAISYANFLDWTRMNQTFQAMAAYRQNDFNLTGSGEAQHVKATQVSATFFPLLGVKPLIGRNFLPHEDRKGTALVVMLSASFWKSKFGASHEILGKTLTFDGQAYAVIGVVPESFYFCCQTTNFRLGDVYVPLGSWNVPWMQDRGAHPGLFAMGRLKPGVTLERARADMNEIALNLARAYPDVDKNAGIALLPLKEEMVGDVRPTLLLLLLAVGFVLLIACVNIANLLLARSTGRAQEFAIRAALGATRGRVLRQLLVESILLAIVGGSLGLFLAVWATRGGLAALPEALPRANDVRVDPHVLLFTLIVSVLAGVLFGLAPLWQISRADVQETLKEGGRGASGARHGILGAFVAVEMGLAVVLLIGAGLMLRSLTNLWNVKPGFKPQNVLKLNVALSSSTQKGTPDQIRAHLQQLTDTIAAVPGVRAVSLTDGAFPMAGDNEVGFWIEGQPQPPTQSEMPGAVNYIVGSGYLSAMGIPLLQGRFFVPQDDLHSQFVAVVDERLQRRYFPNQNPVGQHLHLAGMDQLFEIVGVVGHVNQSGLDETENSPVTSQIYVPITQIPDEFSSLLAKSDGFVVRTQAPNYASVDAIRHAIEGVNSQHVLYGLESMEEIISGSIAARRFTMILLAAFAGLAVLLASVGIYGVISHVVGQRTYEIGIRMALGAERGSVLLMVLNQAGKMITVGVVIGLLASLALTRLMASMLFRVNSYDPPTFLGVAAILSVVALIACYIPARRASRVDPMVALRHE